MSDDVRQADFESVKSRLAEIADAVSDEDLSLDDALDLYEEAVALGLKASDLLETGVAMPDDESGEEAQGGQDSSDSAREGQPDSASDAASGVPADIGQV